MVIYTEKAALIKTNKGEKMTIKNRAFSIRGRILIN
jgi:hypothetical protein